MNFNNLNGYTVEDTAARTAIGSIEEDGTINNISSKFGNSPTVISALNQCLTEEDFTNKLGAINGIATLDPNGKIPASQLTVEAMEYKGKFNASNGTLPTAPAGGFSTGDFYIISVGGTISSIGTLKQDDKIIYNGSGWDWLPAGGVSSVNNKTGDVSLTLDDVPAGTNTISPTIQNLVDLIYPIGSVYISTKPAEGTGKFNPEDIFTETHWKQISKGRVLLGAGSNEANSYKGSQDYGTCGAGTINRTVGEMGGEIKHSLALGEMPSHSHSLKTSDGASASMDNDSFSGGFYFKGMEGVSSTGDGTVTYKAENWGYGHSGPGGNKAGTITIAHSHKHPLTGSTNSKGSGTAHNNIQPYLVVTIWERTS